MLYQISHHKKFLVIFLMITQNFLINSFELVAIKKLLQSHPEMSYINVHDQESYQYEPLLFKEYDVTVIEIFETMLNPDLYYQFQTLHLQTYVPIRAVNSAKVIDCVGSSSISIEKIKQALKEHNE